MASCTADSSFSRIATNSSDAARSSSSPCSSPVLSTKLLRSSSTSSDRSASTISRSSASGVHDLASFQSHLSRTLRRSVASFPCFTSADPSPLRLGNSSTSRTDFLSPSTSMPSWSHPASLRSTLPVADEPLTVDSLRMIGGCGPKMRENHEMTIITSRHLTRILVFIVHRVRPFRHPGASTELAVRSSCNERARIGCALRLDADLTSSSLF